MFGSSGSGPRRPSLAVLALLLVPLLSGCDNITFGSHSAKASKSGSETSSSSSSSDEADRTRRMEEKAAEIDRKAEEIRNMQGTDEEKAEAVRKLDEERRELNEMQEGGK